MLEVISLIATIVGTISGIVVTLRGFGAARAAAKKANDDLRAELMRAIAERTVALEEYKPKIRELHDLHNAAREGNIALTNRITLLERENVELKSLLLRLHERIPK